MTPMRALTRTVLGVSGMTVAVGASPGAGT